MKTATISMLTFCLLLGACHTKPKSTTEKTTATDEKSDHDHGCDHHFASDTERASKETTLTINEKWEKITVDSSLNGGISVEGWDKESIEIFAKISAWDSTEAEAKELLSKVEIVAEGGVIKAEGPNTKGNRGFSASFEIKVPKQSSLDLKSLNGGISIQDVEGSIRATGVNGGLKLANLKGDVEAQAVNGSVSVKLEGDKWMGTGLDVSTTNGSVKLEVPKDYSANLKAQTVNGSIKLDFPVTVQGKISKEINAVLGSGGPAIHLSTVNGSVKIRNS